MAGLTVTATKDEITIKLPLDKQGRDSGSGKSVIHATTSGNQTVVVPGFDKPLSIGVNVYTKK